MFHEVKEPVLKYRWSAAGQDWSWPTAIMHHAGVDKKAVNRVPVGFVRVTRETKTRHSELHFLKTRCAKWKVTPFCRTFFSATLRLKTFSLEELNYRVDTCNCVVDVRRID